MATAGHGPFTLLAPWPSSVHPEQCWPLLGLGGLVLGHTASPGHPTGTAKYFSPRPQVHGVGRERRKGGLALVTLVHGTCTALALWVPTVKTGTESLSNLPKVTQQDLNQVTCPGTAAPSGRLSWEGALPSPEWSWPFHQIGPGRAVRTLISIPGAWNTSPSAPGESKVWGQGQRQVACECLLNRPPFQRQTPKPREAEATRWRPHS